MHSYVRVSESVRFINLWLMPRWGLVWMGFLSAWMTILDMLFI